MPVERNGDGDGAWTPRGLLPVDPERKGNQQAVQIIKSMDTFRSRTTPSIYLGLDFRQVRRAGGHFDGKSAPKEFVIVLGRHCGYVDC